LNCQDLLEQLSDYLDLEARAELCREIEEHLKSCCDCKIVVDKTRKTILLYQANRQVDIPVSVNEKLRVALSKEYGGTTRSAD